MDENTQTELRTVDITSPIAVQPGALAQLPYRMPVDGRLSDVECMAGGQVESVRAGQLTFTRSDDQTWADVLGASARILQGVYVILMTRNIGEEPRVLAARLAMLVEATPDAAPLPTEPRVVKRTLFAEAGAAPPKAEPRVVKRTLFANKGGAGRAATDQRSTVTSAPQRQGPLNKTARQAAYANVRTVKGRKPNATPIITRTASGGACPIRSGRSGRTVVRTSVVSNQPRSGDATNATSVRRAGEAERSNAEERGASLAGPMTPTAPASAPAIHAEVVPSTRHETAVDGLDMFLPDDRVGEKALLLSKGIAYALLRQVERRVPMQPQFRPALTRYVTDAQAREGATSSGMNEIVILLPQDRLNAVGRCAQRGWRPAPDVAEDIARAIRLGLERDVALSQAG